jgi:hypothetical protein
MISPRDSPNPVLAGSEENSITADTPKMPVTMAPNEVTKAPCMMFGFTMTARYDFM